MPVLWSGKHENYEIMVTPLLGKDLGAYLKLLKRFPLKKILNLTVGILKILEQVHKKGFIHRDLKPENIMMGRGNDSNTVYLIDFGISKSILDMKGEHIPYREGKPFIGTCRYASLSAHEGRELGRKDDLESLGYVILYLMQGSLPWQAIRAPDKERIKGVGKMKKDTPFEILCKDLPIEFITYFRYVRSIKFTELPNYKLIYDIFNNIAERENINLQSVDSVEWSQTSYLAIKKKKTPAKRASCQNLKDPSPSTKVNVPVPMTPQAKGHKFKASFDTSDEFQQPRLNKNKSSLLNPQDLSKSKSGNNMRESSFSVSYSSIAFSQMRSICIEDITKINEVEFGQEMEQYIVLDGKEIQYPEDSVQFKMGVLRRFQSPEKLISTLKR